MGGLWGEKAASQPENPEAAAESEATGDGLEDQFDDGFQDHDGQDMNTFDDALGMEGGGEYGVEGGGEYVENCYDLEADQGVHDGADAGDFQGLADIYTEHGDEMTGEPELFESHEDTGADGAGQESSPSGMETSLQSVPDDTAAGNTLLPNSARNTGGAPLDGTSNNSSSAIEMTEPPPQVIVPKPSQKEADASASTQGGLDVLSIAATQAANDAPASENGEILQKANQLSQKMNSESNKGGKERTPESSVGEMAGSLSSLNGAKEALTDTSGKTGSETDDRIIPGVLAPAEPITCAETKAANEGSTAAGSNEAPPTTTTNLLDACITDASSSSRGPQSRASTTQPSARPQKLNKANAAGPPPLTEALVHQRMAATSAGNGPSRQAPNNRFQTNSTPTQLSKQAGRQPLAQSSRFNRSEVQGKAAPPVALATNAVTRIGKSAGGIINPKPNMLAAAILATARNTASILNNAGGGRTLATGSQQQALRNGSHGLQGQRSHGVQDVHWPTGRPQQVNRVSPSTKVAPFYNRAAASTGLSQQKPPCLPPGSTNRNPPATNQTTTPISLRGNVEGHLKTPNHNRRVDLRSPNDDTQTPNHGRAAVTPGPMTALKPQPLAKGFMSMGEAEHNERILPTPDAVRSKRSFENDYADFMRMIRDTKDVNERNDNVILGMRVLLASAYAETLQDQGELAMFLGSLGELNAEMDDEIAEYEEFLSAYPKSSE